MSIPTTKTTETTMTTTDINQIAPPILANMLNDEKHRLGTRDADFATSLIDQFTRRGSLSQKQWVWVRRLYERAVNPRPAVETEDLGDFTGVYRLFQRAGEHLKYPKICLVTDCGRHVVLSVAGERSRYTGQINLTDGRSFGSNTWYGRIDRDGTWTKSRVVDPGIEQLIRRLADDPAEVAQTYGHMTGHCCFCRRPLEDERSTDAGYGPVCAKNYGLPWGGRDRREGAEEPAREMAEGGRALEL